MPYKDIQKSRECGLSSYYRYHEKYKEARRIRYYKNRFTIHGHHYDLKRKLMDMLGQNECLKCGYSDIRALVFDHIYGGGSKENENQNHRHGIRLEYYIAHPLDAFAKLQVLCHNCNHIKKLENEEFRGWAWGYKNKIEN